MKFLFISDNFPPEVNAPATRTWEHCREWVKKGIDVTVLTCFPNFPEGKLFPGYKHRLFSNEYMEGVHVIRVITYITANKGFLRRTIDYISFGFASFIAGLFIRTDLIIATSPQLFTAVWARRLAFFKRRPWVMEVRDLWPESIKSVGVIKENIFLKYFERLELRLYKSASKIITVTDTFKSRMISRGIDPAKISVVQNGANLELYSPREKNKELLLKFGLSEKFTVGFIGTLGMAHRLDFVIDAASKLEDKAIHFLIVGAGSERENLENLLKELRPQNVTLVGMISKAEVPEYLSIIDVALINLRKNDTFKAVIPSKIYESAAMEKPILLGVDGEARKLIESYKAGLAFEPENETDFVTKLLILKNNKQLYNELKDGGKKLAADFDRKKLAFEMKNILLKAVR